MSSYVCVLVLARSHASSGCWQLYRALLGGPDWTKRPGYVGSPNPDSPLPCVPPRLLAGLLFLVFPDSVVCYRHTSQKSACGATAVMCPALRWWPLPSTLAFLTSSLTA